MPDRKSDILPSTVLDDSGPAWPGLELTPKEERELDVLEGNRTKAMPASTHGKKPAIARA